MKKQNYIFWHAIGISITVASLAKIAAQPLTADYFWLTLGVLCSVIGVVINAYNDKGSTVVERFNPMFMDVGANLVAVGIFYEPSLSKILFLVFGILLIELFLLILMKEHF